jgi:hypothetical protein
MTTSHEWSESINDESRACALDSSLTSLLHLRRGIPASEGCRRIGDRHRPGNRTCARIGRGYRAPTRGRDRVTGRCYCSGMAGKASERFVWAVDTLGVRPAERLFEVGCGHGVAVSLVCERLTTGTITAIDRSSSMMRPFKSRGPACFSGVTDTSSISPKPVGARKSSSPSPPGARTSSPTIELFIGAEQHPTTWRRSTEWRRGRSRRP